MEKKSLDLGITFALQKYAFCYHKAFPNLKSLHRNLWGVQHMMIQILGLAKMPNAHNGTCKNARRSWFHKMRQNIVKIFKCIPSCQRLTIESAKLIELFQLDMACERSWCCKVQNIFWFSFEKFWDNILPEPILIWLTIVLSAVADTGSNIVPPASHHHHHHHDWR